MRKVIDGKVYDTDKATRVHSWGNGFGDSDFRSCDETLYRTDKGVFFLHGEGGAKTRWARPYGNSVGSGEGIAPLADNEAREWLETHRAKAAVIEKYFALEEA